MLMLLNNYTLLLVLPLFYDVAARYASISARSDWATLSSRVRIASL